MNISEILSLLDRADSLCSELETEYNKCLESKDVSLLARNLTHEVLEKCSNALDQLMAYSVESRNLLPQNGSRPRGYFPAAKDEAAFRSTMGQWHLVDIDQRDSDFALILRRFQPFSADSNGWLLTLRNLAAAKHTGLRPQTVWEEQRVTVTSPQGGMVSWRPGVTFSGDVRVMGVPIDPRTQLPVKNNVVTTRVERWVSFVFDNTDLNALFFCRLSVRSTRNIVSEFSRLLKLH